MIAAEGNEVNLGTLSDGSGQFVFSHNSRNKHLYICGSTGTGKSKMLEHLIRQDIANWPQSRCGMLLLDPHGSLYDSLINWLAWNAPHLKDVPIIPIDLRKPDWTIGYNVLRPRPTADTSVIVTNFVQAMAYVWGAAGTDKTPLFARICSEVLWPLYERNLTLIEAEHMIDRTAKRVRSEIARGVSNRGIASSWEFANQLSPRDFDLQVSSTVNRFYSFLRTEKLRLMFGQQAHSLDLRSALDEGPIILVNLSGEGNRVSEDDASLFATLLLSDLWAAAKERGKGLGGEDVKPFYVYIDEFQNFITPTIAKNLDQARGYGLHLTLANQFPRQILHAGANGEQVFESVMANARSKIVFETGGRENLEALAFELFAGSMNPEEIKNIIYSTKVLDYVEETRRVRSESTNWSEATGRFIGATATESESGAISNGSEEDPEAWNRSKASSDGTSHMNVGGGGVSESDVPFLRPVIGKEESSREYRSLDEQLFIAMAALHDQEQRHAVARLVGMRKPVAIVTPTVNRPPSSPEMISDFLDSCYARWPFAIRSSEAEKRIKEREATFLASLNQPKNEPTSAMRLIPEPPSAIQKITDLIAEKPVSLKAKIKIARKAKKTGK